eukprot:scaffold2136_cov242-Pinguiococcus_pyrenoidosus.AAC.16
MVYAHGTCRPTKHQHVHGMLPRPGKTCQDPTSGPVQLCHGRNGDLRPRDSGLDECTSPPQSAHRSSICARCFAPLLHRLRKRSGRRDASQIVLAPFRSVNGRDSFVSRDRTPLASRARDRKLPRFGQDESHGEDETCAPLGADAVSVEGVVQLSPHIRTLQTAAEQAKPRRIGPNGVQHGPGERPEIRSGPWRPGGGAGGASRAALARAGAGGAGVGLLRRLGLASKFAVEFGATPVSSAVGMTTNGLEQRTGLPLSAFRPSPATGRMYLLGGVGLSVVEVLLARQLGISPQPLFLLTALVLGIDQVLLGGAVFETLLSSVRPEIKNRVVYHEAGHLLLAYLLGCPVQSVTLSAIETLQRTSIGVLAPGTAFFDAELNRSAQTGIISRDTLDRYSIVVMGGIAAEAMVFGAAEGGRDDERTLIEFLQRNVASNTGGFGMDQVAEQARWSAVNAIELLRKHRDMYDRLVAILEKNRGESIGACILEMEGHPVTS